MNIIFSVNIFATLIFYFYKFAWKIVTQGNYSPIILKPQKLCIILDVVDLSLWHRVFFIHGSHGGHGNFVEGDSTNRKEAVFTYGLFYNKININHCTNDFNNNYNFLRCKYTNNNDMFQIFWALFFLGCHRNRSMSPSPSVTVDSWQFPKTFLRFK